MHAFFKLAAVILLLSSCGSASVSNQDASSKETPSPATASKPGDRQLNLNILWDLSDRIDTVAHPASPQQYVRDLEVIKTLATYFKKDMEARGAYKVKGRIRVFFSPAPSDGPINTIAANLSCDLSTLSGDGANRKKKEFHDSIENRFYRNAEAIYRLTVANHKARTPWEGSDIWRFFKNDVSDYCIDPSGAYRNVLVLLTDGYLYHKNSKEKRGNRTSYILPATLQPLRNKEDWTQRMAAGDYGLISTRKDLKNLEVLVLQIAPSKEYAGDEDLIKAYLGKWLQEMGIPEAQYKCYNTDLPEYTRKKIENFLNR